MLDFQYNAENSLIATSDKGTYCILAVKHKTILRLSATVGHVDMIFTPVGDEQYKQCLEEAELWEKGNADTVP